MSAPGDSARLGMTLPYTIYPLWPWSTFGTFGVLHPKAWRDSDRQTRLDGCMRSLLPPRPDVPSRHTGSLNKVTRGDFISHVDNGRRIRAASLRCGRCEMWRHQCMAGEVLVLFMPSGGVAIQGTWLQMAGLSRFGFPFGGPTTPAPVPAAECDTRGLLPPIQAASVSKSSPPSSHGCPTARAAQPSGARPTVQCQHASCYVLSRALPVKRNTQPGCSPHTHARKVRAVSRNLDHHHALPSSPRTRGKRRRQPQQSN